MALIWARDQQPESGPEDEQLVVLARRRNPTVAWWWGRSREQGQARLRCYICGVLITPAAAAHVLPHGAIEAIMEHRRHELELHRPRLATFEGDSA